MNMRSALVVVLVYLVSVNGYHFDVSCGGVGTHQLSEMGWSDTDKLSPPEIVSTEGSTNMTASMFFYPTPILRFTKEFADQETIVGFSGSVMVAAGRSTVEFFNMSVTSNLADGNVSVSLTQLGSYNYSVVRAAKVLIDGDIAFVVYYNESNVGYGLYAFFISNSSFAGSFVLTDINIYLSTDGIQLCNGVLLVGVTDPTELLIIDISRPGAMRILYKISSFETVSRFVQCNGTIAAFLVDDKQTLVTYNINIPAYPVFISSNQLEISTYGFAWDNYLSSHGSRGVLLGDSSLRFVDIFTGGIGNYVDISDDYSFITMQRNIVIIQSTYGDVQIYRASDSHNDFTLVAEFHMPGTLTMTDGLLVNQQGGNMSISLFLSWLQISTGLDCETRTGIELHQTNENGELHRASISFLNSIMPPPIINHPGMFHMENPVMLLFVTDEYFGTDPYPTQVLTLGLEMVRGGLPAGLVTVPFGPNDMMLMDSLVPEVPNQIVGEAWELDDRMSHTLQYNGISCLLVSYFVEYGNIERSTKQIHDLGLPSPTAKRPVSVTDEEVVLVAVQNSVFQYNKYFAHVGGCLLDSDVLFVSGTFAVTETMMHYIGTKDDLCYLNFSSTVPTGTIIDISSAGGHLFVFTDASTLFEYKSDLTLFRNVTFLPRAEPYHSMAVDPLSNLIVLCSGNDSIFVDRVTMLVKGVYTGQYPFIRVSLIGYGKLQGTHSKGIDIITYGGSGLVLKGILSTNSTSYDMVLFVNSSLGTSSESRFTLTD